MLEEELSQKIESAPIPAALKRELKSLLRGMDTLLPAWIST